MKDKQIIYTLLVCLIFWSQPIFIIAQEIDNSLETDEEKSEFFAEKGSFGIGINAGALLNNALNNEPYGVSKSFTLRYFVIKNGAIRLTLGSDFSEVVDNHSVADDAARIINPFSNAMVVDRATVSTHDYFARIGYQHYFFQKQRTRAFAGIDVSFNYINSNHIYSYGNIMNEFNTNPTSYSFYEHPNGRVTQVKDATKTVYGAALFAGGEYYLLPRLCLAIEFGFMFSHQLALQEFVSYEMIVEGQNVKVNEMISPNSRVSGVPSYTRFSLFFDF